MESSYIAPASSQQSKFGKDTAGSYNTCCSHAWAASLAGPPGAYVILSPVAL